MTRPIVDYTGLPFTTQIEELYQRMWAKKLLSNPRIINVTTLQSVGVVEAVEAWIVNESGFWLAG